MTGVFGPGDPNERRTSYMPLEAGRLVMTRPEEEPGLPSESRAGGGSTLDRRGREGGGGRSQTSTHRARRA